MFVIFQVELPMLFQSFKCAERNVMGKVNQYLNFLWGETYLTASRLTQALGTWDKLLASFEKFSVQILEHKRDKF